MEKYRFLGSGQTPRERKRRREMRSLKACDAETENGEGGKCERWPLSLSTPSIVRTQRQRTEGNLRNRSAPSRVRRQIILVMTASTWPLALFPLLLPQKPG
ncbi:hypothetical protein Nepgr_024397 [Nepenthes gracilis]|uniref:Uncharacterized protein n=1 Tax=Nepenthes gracilis TaxID=150966 RepID=A0AAD3T4K4_NEPGR|nr:hypothetical protein Nepgr_024397 [Nepenthes gracilis]